MSPRDVFSKRTLIYGGSTTAAVILVLGILVVIGLLSQRFNYRWDTTPDKSQSLTQVSRTWLKEVKQPLSMTAFFPENNPDRQRGREILQMFANANRNITVHLVDPDRDPLKARTAGYRYPGNVLLEYQGRKQMTDKTAEEALTNAIRKLLNPQSKKVYFLVGHGERPIKDNEPGGFGTASKALDNEGFQVESLNLLTQPEVPQDASVLVVAGPTKPLFPNEVAAIQAYLHRGGRALLMLAPFKDGGLKDFLAGYGLQLDDGIILDMNQLTQAIGASPIMPVAVKYGPHRITRNFTNILTIYPMARPLTLEQGKAAAWLPLVTTTDTSWEKLGQDWLKEGKASAAPTDRKGPFTLAALGEIKLPAKKEEKGAKPEKAPPQPQQENKTYLAVYGNVDFAANSYFNLSGNGDLFLNTVNFLGSEEKLIQVRRQERKAQPLTLLSWQAWVLFLTTLVVIPLIMLAAGVQAYLRRRGGRK